VLCMKIPLYGTKQVTHCFFKTLMKHIQNMTYKQSCMFMMQLSCPDIFKAVRGLARHITAPREAHVRALVTLVKYVTHTKNRVLVLALRELWSNGYNFKIHGQSDSDYMTNPDDHRSISRGREFMNDTPKKF
jgi:hypothetical protein